MVVKNGFKIKINILVLLSFTMLFSCKKKIESKPKNILDITVLQSQIPKEYVIKKIDTFNLDNDSIRDYIITAHDENNSLTHEYWFKNKKLITTLQYPIFDINFKWIVNIDDDETKEIIRAQGFEDGIDYVIYDIYDNKQIPLLYFNPAVIDEKYSNKIFWGYPWDIKQLIQNDEGQLLVSLSNNYERDGVFTKPNEQLELPFVYFKGKTTQPDMVLHNLKPSEELRFPDLLKRVRSLKASDKLLAIHEFLKDINEDGIEDKIVVYKNQTLQNKYDQEHFQLPIKVFKGTKNGFQIWKENDSLIYSNANNCVAEGFNNIVVKGKYFTIEAQTCYDYNILVSGYITFKVSGNDIYLHKYGEEYFDKANHENEIPAKNKDVSDFGEIKFENLIEKKLYQIIN
ncbi:hypothetical protein [Flavobacterium sp. J27]|uniref:hypothetical protein n=1 Tax=Flavobacterium sp. J27 TaxID=2060419 RepID=UPI001030425E|nr:hypothetical protein [Flavobacterium sp. J27]